MTIEYIALFEQLKLNHDEGDVDIMTDIIWNLCHTMIVDAKHMDVSYETLKATWLDVSQALELPQDALRLVLEDMSVAT